jgi:Lrp/AsnC family transcriptional regulator, regulator for asnA, asnC and gidA
MRLDLLDRELIRLLGVDGRQPNTEIARRLGVTEGAVRKRIARLVRENVVRIGAWADPLRIGYQTYTMFEMQVSPRHIESVAQRLARLPEIYFLCICTGAYDITRRPASAPASTSTSSSPSASLASLRSYACRRRASPAW